MEHVTIIGIDLRKRSFQLHGATTDGSVAFCKKMSRGKLLEFMASQPRCVVAMEGLCEFAPLGPRDREARAMRQSWSRRST